MKGFPSRAVLAPPFLLLTLHASRLASVRADPFSDPPVAGEAGKPHPDPAVVARLRAEAEEMRRKWGTTLILPRDEGALQELDLVRAAIGRERWKEAAEILQRLLDRPAGILPSGEDRILRETSDVCEETLRKGPPPLLAAYRELAEGRAAASLREAVAKRANERLAEVARRYGATASGARARMLLLRSAVEAEDWSLARRAFSELARREPASLRSCETSLLVLHDGLRKEGDVSWTGEILAAVGSWGGPNGGGLEASPWKERVAERERRARDAGGPGARSGAEKAQSVWDQRWALLDAAANRLGGVVSAPRHDKPQIPREAGGRIWVQDGARARCLAIEGGRLLADGPAALASYEIEPGRQVALDLALAEGAGYLTLPVSPPQFDRQVSAIVALPTQDLFCFDPATGKPRWRAKESARKAGKPYPDEWSFPSVPAAGKDALYAPCAAFKGLFSSSLAALSKADGSLLWRTYLCSGQQEMNYFGRPLRESVPSPAALDAGRVLVSTNLGVAAAVDAADGRILWLYQYDQVPLANQQTQMWDIPPRLSGWANARPALLGPVAVFAPTDSPRIYALDAATGRLRWSAEIEEAQHVLADVPAGVVCVSGPRGARGIDAASGKLRWVSQESFPHPGHAAGGTFYFATGRSLAGIDAATGKLRRLVAGFPWAGPLWTDGSRGVSATPQGIVGWEIVAEGKKPQ